MLDALPSRRWLLNLVITRGTTAVGGCRPAEALAITQKAWRIAARVWRWLWRAQLALYRR